MVRAKFKCISEKTTAYNRSYEFLPVTSGSPENAEFFKTTPAGKIELTVNNDAVYFQIGKDYYIDFTPEIVEV